jgi:hypothetical protein
VPYPKAGLAHDLARAPTAVAHLMAHSYWAAEGRIWQLQVFARQASNAMEQAALSDLLDAERLYQSATRRALAAISGGSRLDLQQGGRG